jgi:phosphate:Na+ symporter
LRWQAVQNRDISAGEKGALLSLLGSVERAEGLIERIVTERASVDRSTIGIRAAGMSEGKRPEAPLAGNMVPAE